MLRVACSSPARGVIVILASDCKGLRGRERERGKQNGMQRRAKESGEGVGLRMHLRGKCGTNAIPYFLQKHTLTSSLNIIIGHTCFTNVLHDMYSKAEKQLIFFRIS